MKKIILIIFFLAVFFTVAVNSAGATQLPQPIIDFIKSKYPDVAVRFDGLIELPDHTIYLPVTPLTYGKSETPAAVIQTIPANTDFTKRPDMILFADNLALLKIIKTDNELTVNYSPQIPLCVKLGLLPQDLIVPKGLVLPTELKVILGDLKIAIKEKKDEDDLVFFGETPKSAEKKVNIITKKATAKKEIVKYPTELEFLRDKVLYAANFKENKINIIDSATGRINKSMKLPAIPSNMVLTPDQRYLFIPSMASNKVFVIDTYSNLFLKDFEVGRYPSSILMIKDCKKAYIANKLSSSISEIDLNDMALKKEINVSGNPDNLVSDKDGQNIFYNDANSNNIYVLNLKTGISKIVTKVDNISKIAQNGDYLYVLSRLNGELVVFDLTKNAVTTKVKVGEKPVDIQILSKTGKIYVLSAGSDELNIIDMKDFKITNTISLKSGGFPGGITILEDRNKAMITNEESFQTVIFDMKKETITGYLPISKNVSFLQISDQFNQ